MPAKIDDATMDMVHVYVADVLEKLQEGEIDVGSAHGAVVSAIEAATGDQATFVELLRSRS